MALRASLREDPFPLDDRRAAHAKRRQIGDDVPALIWRELAGEATHRCTRDAHGHDSIQERGSSIVHLLRTADCWWLRVEPRRGRTVTQPPRPVTGRATLFVYRSPRRDVDRTLWQLERGLAPERVRKPMTQLGEQAWRALCGHGGDDRIQYRARRVTALTRQPLRTVSRVGEKIDRLLIFL